MQQGLGSKLAGQSAPQESPQGEYTVDQVAQMLLDGKEPEELLAMGITEELIVAAIDLLEAELGAQGGPQPAPAPAGLAESLVQRG